jgi:hypothetical protein
MGSGSVHYPSPMAEYNTANLVRFRFTLTSGPEQTGYIWLGITGLPIATSYFVARGEGPALLNDDLEVVGEGRGALAEDAITGRVGSQSEYTTLWLRLDPMDAESEQIINWEVGFDSIPATYSVTIDVLHGTPIFEPDGPAAIPVWTRQGKLAVEQAQPSE